MRTQQYKRWMDSVKKRCETKEGLDQVMIELNNELNEDPDNPELLFHIGYVLILAGKLGFAYHVYKRLTEIAPYKFEVWVNLARCCLIKTGTNEALEYLQTAAAMNPRSAGVLFNTAITYINLGNGELAEMAARKAIEVSPNNKKASDNLGIALLGQRKWDEGFVHHNTSLGGEGRTRHTYNNQPDWDGQERDGDIVIYGEQGLGDEILYGSIVPDAIKAIGNGKIILNVDRRLQGMFERSFPKTIVYGGRHAYPRQQWEKEHTIVGQASLGQLTYLFRRDGNFPGTPYLEPCPIRMTAYESMIQRHIQNKKSRPRIGLCWQGGRVYTRERAERCMRLEDFYALIDPEVSGIDADWFVLEYADVNEEIGDFKRAHPELSDRLHYFPWILQGNDYDSTGALVASLYSVVAVPTTAVHLAGSMGVNCHVFVPAVPQWRFGFNREWTDFPWHRSVTLFRRQPGENGEESVMRFVPELRNSLVELFDMKKAAQS